MMAQQITSSQTRTPTHWYQPVVNLWKRFERLLLQHFLWLGLFFAPLQSPKQSQYKAKRPRSISVDSRHLTVPASTAPKPRPAPIQSPSEPPSPKEEEFHTAKSSASVYTTPATSPLHAPSKTPKHAPTISESDMTEICKSMVPLSVAPIFKKIAFPITQKLTNEMIFDDRNHGVGFRFNATTTGFTDTFKVEFDQSHPHISLEVDKSLEWTQTVKNGLQVIHFTKGLTITRQLKSPSAWDLKKYGAFWAKNKWVEYQLPQLTQLPSYNTWKKDSANPLNIQFDQLQLEEYKTKEGKTEFSLSCKATCTFGSNTETIQISSEDTPRCKERLQGWTSGYILHVLKNMKSVE